MAPLRAVSSPEIHLNAAIDWLIRAHDAGRDGGVSYGYSVRGGWRAPYIETTGYIAVTFFNIARSLRNPGLRDRAVRMADWLLGVQNVDGSFCNPRYRADQGLVFDTGQVLFGLVAAYQETRDSRFLDAAERAGDWLVQAADEQGHWARSDFLGFPHVYNTRTAWALLELCRQTPHPEREWIARRNLNWALSQQVPSGLFENCAFRPTVAPFTHTIAYAIRGLWEAGQLLGADPYRDAALAAADAMLAHVGDDGFIPGQVQPDGQPAARYCCLTGNCQLSISWAKMHRATRDGKFREAAVSALRYVMAFQDTASANPNMRGAIKGSQPIWGAYSPFTYPNWATKFFVDAIEECGEWLGGDVREPSCALENRRAG